MERITDQLNDVRIIGLDTSVFIYNFEEHPIYLPIVKEVLGGVERGRWQGVISAVTIMEINVRPFRLGLTEVARKYEALLAHFPNLHIIDVDREVARRAALLRARFQLRPADALQVASCISAGARAFVTNDRRLLRVGDLIRVLVIDDFAPA